MFPTWDLFPVRLVLCLTAFPLLEIFMVQFQVGNSDKRFGDSRDGHHRDSQGPGDLETEWRLGMLCHVSREGTYSAVVHLLQPAAGRKCGSSFPL